MRCSITVIGGGVIGLASALALIRAGHRVTVVDDDIDGQAASWGNAGHIAIEQVEPLASWATVRSMPARLFPRGGAVSLPPRAWRHWLPFGLRLIRAGSPRRFRAGKAALGALLGEAMPAWRRLAAGLGDPELLVEAGHYVGWSTPEKVCAGWRNWESADIGTATFRDATPAERAMLPGAPAGAIRFVNTGQIADLGQLAAAMRATLQAAGGEIRTGCATLSAESGRAVLMLDGVPVEDAGTILVAAGVRSAALLAPFGHVAPIIAERGYHLRSTDHDWPAGLPPLVFEDRSMIVTRYADCVQVASFVEFAGQDTPPDPAKWARLEAHIAALGLPIRGPYTRWMGARPTLPDYLPAIGRSSRADNLYYAFGHQHLGLTLAAVTGEIMAAMVGDQPVAASFAGFSLDRFEGVRGR